MADGKLYLNYRGAGTADEIKKIIDTIVGELGLPEEIEDYIFVLRMGKKAVLRAKEFVEDPAGSIDIYESIPAGIDAVKLVEIIKRWKAKGFDVSLDGGMLVFHPRHAPDP